MHEFDQACNDFKAQCSAKPQEDGLPGEGPVAERKDKEEDQHDLERDV